MNNSAVIFIDNAYLILLKNYLFRTSFLVLIFVFLISLTSAIPQTFNIHWKLSDSGGALTGTYEMILGINLVERVEI